MTGTLSCGGMGIWFLTARHRWSIRSMDMSNGEAARGSSTRRPQWTLIGWPMVITSDGLAPLFHDRVFQCSRQGFCSPVAELGRSAARALLARWGGLRDDVGGAAGDVGTGPGQDPGSIARCGSEPAL